MTAGVSGAPTTVVLAEPDRRFYAFAIDRIVAWVLYAAVAVALGFTLFQHGSVLIGIVLLALVVLFVWFVGALLTGLGGATPGKSAAGLKVVDAGDGRPIGLGRALVRQGVLGVLTLPTIGIGAATLAWMATVDPTGQRRGLHDRWARSVVIDVRHREAPVAEGAPQPPRRIVNLTAMRLRPVPAEPVAAPPPRRDRGTQSGVQPLPGAVPSSAGPRHASGPQAAAAYSAPGWRVSFDTGESFVVSGLALVGRGPEPQPGEQVAHLVALTSRDMSLSKTHAQFQVASDGSLVVMDRGSTNGSTLIRQGASRPLGSRKPATLVDGDRVRFGDREMLVRREG